MSSPLVTRILDFITVGQNGDPPLLVFGDIEAFFFIFFNNFLNMAITFSLLVDLCGYDAQFVQSRIIPGTGTAVALGSVFYWWQARRKAKAEGRATVTALPFGISTPSLFAFAFFIVLPERRRGGDSFAVAIFSCLWSGILEAATVFYGFLVRRFVPTSALVSSLSGIAVALIATGALYEIFQFPTLALLPLLLFMFATVSRAELRFPSIHKLPRMLLPWTVVIIMVGTVIYWILVALGSAEVKLSRQPMMLGFYLPRPSFIEIFQGFSNSLKYMSLMISLALINGVGSLQILVSAKNRGDDFDTTSSLLINGFATILASCFGAVFPTTLYIGHPTMKLMGARSGYMLLHAIAIWIVSTFGFIQLFLKYIPTSTLLPILVYVGLQMTAEGFHSDDHEAQPDVPRRYHLAVAIGLIPSLSNLTVQAATNALQVANVSLKTVFQQFAPSSFYLGGAIALSQGFLLSSILLSATIVFWIDRKYSRSSVMLFISAGLSWIGLIHSYQITDDGIHNLFITQNGSWIAAPGFVIGYGIMGLFMLAISVVQRFLKVWNQGNLILIEGHYQWAYDSLPTVSPNQETTEPTELDEAVRTSTTTPVENMSLVLHSTSNPAADPE